MYFEFFIIAMALTLYAQYWVNATYKKFSKVPNRKGYTGADVARELLNRAGIYDVSVEMVGGHLTDHYDPSSKVLRLSQSVYGSTSVAALGVAAHETGHAIQDDTGYAFLRLRSWMVPITNLGSKLSIPLIFLGMLFTSNTGYMMMQLGVLLFGVAMLFTIVTLPVEFDASNRAVQMLGDYNFLDDDELGGAKKVLKAAALTYVAAAAVAIANFLRLLALLGLGRNRD
jgi:Zn-dependent membrane protease YugP